MRRVQTSGCRVAIEWGIVMDLVLYPLNYPLFSIMNGIYHPYHSPNIWVLGSNRVEYFDDLYCSKDMRSS